MAGASVMMVCCHDEDEAIRLRSEIKPEQWSEESVLHGEEVMVLGTDKATQPLPAGGFEFVDFVRVQTFAGAVGWVKAKFLQPTVSKMVVRCRNVAPRFDDSKVLRAQLDPVLWLNEAVADGETVTAVSVANGPDNDGQTQEFVLVRTAAGVEGWVKRCFLQPVAHPPPLPRGTKTRAAMAGA
eukprot:TRINITY_DN75199_c0_g1_i1.p1 TRINITY_DN75199_c0_g1~~TRINITY_DN75199_c0_g1_i1.p1  ORF type:complete len:202 (+),score=33.55 TRINITY_DN75199_c0_g1_i1:60-608(+)